MERKKFIICNQYLFKSSLLFFCVGSVPMRFSLVFGFSREGRGINGDSGG